MVAAREQAKVGDVIVASLFMEGAVFVHEPPLGGVTLSECGLERTIACQLLRSYQVDDGGGRADGRGG